MIETQKEAGLSNAVATKSAMGLTSAAPTMKVSCLGPQGSYSEIAAQSMCNGYEIVLCPSFTEAVHRLLEGEVDYAVLPVENSLNGGVLECLDLLEEEDIFACREFPLPVDHRLATLVGVKPSEIDCIYSHEQAFGQCAAYLAKNFPNVRFIPTSSTAESLNQLDAHSAGIVGAHIDREDVILSEENIADNKNNFTRFILAERRGALPTRSAMVFFSAVCADRPGSLLGLLKIFLRHGLNLTRIESRPVKEEFGQYRFFIEFAGDLATDWVQKALVEAQAYCVQYKLLGAYQ